MNRGAAAPEERVMERGLGMPEEDAAQKRTVRAMFDSVAHRYDFLNHLLSAGIDRAWRRRAVRELRLEPGHRVLDLCTGTGDLGFACLDAGAVQVVGVDLARGMLARGAAKGRRRNRAGMAFLQGDAEHIGLADAAMDRACVGFGIRNVASLRAALAETARVLRPGGIFVILEFTTPPNAAVRGLYHFYFRRVLPLVGGVVSGNRHAYTYLPDSVSKFPSPPDLAELLRRSGFREARWSLLTGGIACLHVARR